MDRKSGISAAFALCCAMLIPAAAHAGLKVAFDEGAPKDRFRIENVSACTIANSTVLLDLSTSKAGLIFDVTASGAGVEVFQPFEITEGETSLSGLPTVVDGDTALRLDVKGLAPGKAVAFTIDVDDTIGQRETIVSGSEIEGATISIASGADKATAVFSTLATAEVPVAGC